MQITVCGGGLAGSFMALCLATKGLRVELIDKNPVKKLDGRTLAISAHSKKLFEKLNIWNDIAPYAMPIKTVTVLEHPNTVCLESFFQQPIAHIIEYNHVIDALYAGLSNLKINLRNFSLDSVERQKDSLILKNSHNQIMQTNLLIGSDGHDSLVRKLFKIKHESFAYNHFGLVLHFIHEKPHNNVAFEIITKHGILAILPMRPKGGG